MNIKLYFRTNPLPEILIDVKNLITEGLLLRIVCSDGLSQWFPFDEIHRIKEYKSEN